jgi:hypothetical protein
VEREQDQAGGPDVRVRMDVDQDLRGMRLSRGEEARNFDQLGDSDTEDRRVGDPEPDLGRDR